MNDVPTNGYKSGSNLERVLAAGQFAVTGELGPPKGHNPEVIREKAGLIKGYVDAANITDNQTAIVRMSSIGAGLLAMQEGVEPVIQMTCRDRNRLAMQSDLLGAAAHGLKNVLCLSGDHQSFGNHPTAKNVHDVDSMQLLRMLKDLRDESKFQCGEEIKGGGPCFFIGAAANPFGDPFEFRPHRLAKKVDDKYANKTVNCPKCKRSISISDLSRQGKNNSRYSISDFVNRTAQQDRGQGLFELESDRLLEINLSGMVWTKMGSMVAYLGSIKFTREGVFEHGVKRLLKRAVTGEGTTLTKAEGQGTLYLADYGKKISILNLQGDSICVNGNDLLAFEGDIEDLQHPRAIGEGVNG